MVYAIVFSPSQRKQFQSLAYFAGEKIYPGIRTESSSEYIRICDQSALQLLSNTVKIVGLIQISTAIVTSFSMLAFIIDDEIQLSVPVLFPFTDLESVNGLMINILNQVFLGFLAFVGTMGVEILTCILKNCILVISATISHAIDEITKKIEKPETCSKLCIDRYFRNILIQAQDLDRYVSTLKTVDGAFCKDFY